MEELEGDGPDVPIGCGGQSDIPIDCGSLSDVSIGYGCLNKMLTVSVHTGAKLPRNLRSSQLESCLTFFLSLWPMAESVLFKILL